MALCEPRFDVEAIERVRAQMSAGLRREAKDPDALASRAWRDAAFPNHPYGRPMRGTLESLPVITRDDLVGDSSRDDHAGDTKYRGGRVDRRRPAGSILDDVFGDLPASAKLKPIADVALAAGERRSVIDLDVPQATIRFGSNGIARLDPDHMAAVVVNHILGGGVFSARLFREVREKRGLAYSVHTQLATFDHAALFSGGTSTKNERAAESLSVIEAEIAKMAAEGPTADELDKAKKYLTGSYALRFNSSLKIASQLVHLQTEGLEVDYLDQRNALIEAVTLADANRVVETPVRRPGTACDGRWTAGGTGLNASRVSGGRATEGRRGTQALSLAQINPCDRSMLPRPGERFAYPEWRSGSCRSHRQARQDLTRTEWSVRNARPPPRSAADRPHRGRRGDRAPGRGGQGTR